MKSNLVLGIDIGGSGIKGAIVDVKTGEMTTDRYRIQRLTTYIRYIENMFWPDLIIIGGGFAKKFEKKGVQFETRTKIVPAQLLNEAGIIGAAVAAKKLLKNKK